VKDLIDLGLQKRVTVVNSGLKAFARNNKDCDVRYRICHEGSHFLAPHMSKRKYTLDRQDFDKCAQGDGMLFADLSEPFCEWLRPLASGSFIVFLKGYEDQYDHQKLMLTMWRCRGEKVETLVAKAELEAIQSKLGVVLADPVPDSADPVPVSEAAA
jgi:hypothetical protein